MSIKRGEYEIFHIHLFLFNPQKKSKFVANEIVDILQIR